jgi:hypothetical protein
MMRRLPAVALGAAALVGPSAAYARQSTPAAPPTDLKVEAQEPASGAEDGFVTKLRRVADEWQLVARLNGDIDGWYPRLGGMTTESGFPFGPGYRTHLSDNRVLLDLSTAITTKGYKAVDTKAEWLQSRHPRLELWTSFRYQDFTQEDFYGLGFSSNLAARTNYGLVSKDVSTMTIFHGTPWLRMGAEVGYFDPTIGRGTDKNVPSTELAFSDADAPGLASQPNFLHTTLFSEVDYRDERGNARSGGYYKAAYGKWDDRTLHQFDFGRFDAQAAQYIPLRTKKHVLAARMGLSTVNNEADDRVPFYFRPYVGGSDTLRSFKEFRFIDENSFFLNAEYRWAVVKFLDVAFFWDGGKVTRNWHDVNLRALKTAYGIGFRAATTKRVFARLDIAAGGGEGHQIFFKLGPSF